ncbi:MAG: restriction endonuclease subunit S [Haliscomenobacter sp.]|nr:restriction endonuclease subunit S [Haliscomenobacter sp.]
MIPYEKYKDSGVAWIGAVPEHWEVKRLKYSTSINDEVLPETTEKDAQIEYIEIADVQAGQGIVSSTSYRFENAPSRARRVVGTGDIIVSTVRTYLKAIAKIKNPVNNLIVSTGFAVIRPQNVNSDFLGNVFFSENLLGEIISKSTGVSYPAISSSEIGNIKIPIPPPRTNRHCPLPRPKNRRNRPTHRPKRTPARAVGRRKNSPHQPGRHAGPGCGRENEGLGRCLAGGGAGTLGVFKNWLYFKSSTGSLASTCR